MELLKKNAWFLGFAILGLALGGYIWFVMPHEREVTSLGIFLFKLLPFVCMAIAIALLDVELFKKLKLHFILIPVAFLVYFCYFVPKIFFNMDEYPMLYYTVLTVTPIIILSLSLAYRLGGGSGGSSARLSFAMLLLMLSGLEDLAYLTVNHHTDPQWATIPEVWTWASHMTVFIGHAPTKTEAYIFIVVHVILALLVLFLPSKVFGQLGATFGRFKESMGGRNVSKGSNLRDS